MTKKKTVLQKIIGSIEKSIKGQNECDTIVIALRAVIELAKSLLPEERQQIIAACEHTGVIGVRQPDGELGLGELTPESYLEETYETIK